MHVRKLVVDAVYGGFAAAALSCAFVQPALAQPQGVSVQSEKDGIRTVRVSHADLNLSSPAGRETLDRRVKYAVEEVCRPSGGASLKATMQCRRRAATAARPQMLAAIQRSDSIQLAAAGK